MMNKKCIICFSLVVTFLLLHPALAETYREADNPSNTANGLDYFYYKIDSLDELPNFNNLIADETGQITNFELGKQDRDYRFAFLFNGYIYVPYDTTYTFYLKSDDGSKLYIGDSLVVNNDGDHEVQEESGSIALSEGMHEITVEYFEKRGDEYLEVKYEGSDINKQNIPDYVLYRSTGSSNGGNSTYREADTPEEVVNGVDYIYVHTESTTDSVDDLDDFAAKKHGFATNFDIEKRTRDYRYGFTFTGYVYVAEDGNYTFYTTTDDGSQFFIGDQLVVDNDGLHTTQEESGSIGLKAGYHTYTLYYFENRGQEALEVKYEGPNLTKKNIPDSALYREFDPGSEPVCDGDPYKVTGQADGYLKVFFDSDCVGEFRAYFRTGSKKTICEFYNDNKNIVTLGPHRKRLKLLDSYTGQIKEVVRLSDADQNKGSLQLVDLRNDGKIQALVTTKKNKKVRLSMVKIKKNKLVFGKKRTKTFNGKNIKPSYTEYDEDNNYIYVKNKKKEIKKTYYVTDIYDVKIVK